jgi:hypothetical protein
MRMKICAAVLLVSFTAIAQESTFKDSLLDCMIGRWVLSGTIDGRQTTHDVVVEWVLAHQYLQLRETSREKNAGGSPAYEAIVYIGWDALSHQYACLWLDVTGGGGLSSKAIGHGKRAGEKIPFLFIIGTTSFHTTFEYARTSDAWRWYMDGEENGKLVPFARLTMTRQ